MWMSSLKELHLGIFLSACQFQLFFAMTEAKDLLAICHIFLVKVHQWFICRCIKLARRVIGVKVAKTVNSNELANGHWYRLCKKNGFVSQKVEDKSRIYFC
jgi:hypothetical protein